MSDKRKISDLIPDHANANKGTERGRYALEASLRQYGAGRSILLDKNGRIIAGNKTAEVAADVGLDDVLIVQTDGKQIVAVQRTDLDIDSPEGRGLAYADNRVGELSLEWDAQQVLADLDAGMDLSGLWRQDELDELLADFQPKTTEGDTEPQIDRAEELRQKWGVESGQMWQLGEHRLICGDCTDASVVVRLLNGEKPALMVTDPPYGVEYDPMFRNEAFGAAVRRTGIVQNDNRSDWRQAWNLFTGDVVYCWSSMLNANTLLSSFTDIGFDIRAEIIWSKPHFPFGRGHYVAQHESCWYFVRKGKTSGWTRDNAQSTVWEIELDSTADGGHGTQKPLECMLRPIRNHGDSSSIVYEPFSGSGTTIIACENLSRRCRAVEISPAYVAVALERWATHTGKTPTLIPNDAT
jgi:DNA modification methylase